MSKFPCAGGICTPNASPAPTLLPCYQLWEQHHHSAKTEYATTCPSMRFRDVCFIPAVCLVRHTAGSSEWIYSYLQNKATVKSNLSMGDGSRTFAGSIMQRHCVFGCWQNETAFLSLQSYDTVVQSMAFEFKSCFCISQLEKGVVTHSSILAWRIPGQRSLVGYSLWGRKELDTAKQLTHTHTSQYFCFLIL